MPVTFHSVFQTVEGLVALGTPTVLAVGPGGEMEARFIFNAADARRIESIEKFWVEIKYTSIASRSPAHKLANAASASLCAGERDAIEVLRRLLKRVHPTTVPRTG